MWYRAKRGEVQGARPGLSKASARTRLLFLVIGHFTQVQVLRPVWCGLSQQPAARPAPLLPLHPSSQREVCGCSLWGHRPQLDRILAHSMLRWPDPARDGLGLMGTRRARSPIHRCWWQQQVPVANVLTPHSSGKWESSRSATGSKPYKGLLLRVLSP